MPISLQVQAVEGCQLANAVWQLLQTAADAQVQAGEGCQLADGVRQLLQACADAQVQAGEGCQQGTPDPQPAAAGTPAA
jgi:hypothetical protein